MNIEPIYISLLALLLSLVMGCFGVFTWRQKASHDETAEIKAENAENKKAIAELKAALLFSESERTRLTRDNYNLMQELLDKRGSYVPPPSRAG